MLFSEIIGQDDLKQRFSRAVNSGRISHAQLFIGKAGSGKLPLAIAYAQYVSCLNRTETDSCGKCPSCNKYQKLIHPDLHFVYPVVKNAKLPKPVSGDYAAQWREIILATPYFGLNEWMDKIGAENAQPSIYTHESQEILRIVNMKTYEAEYKVLIIWLPEAMHISAANKLLKVLEEPPPKTLFILVTDNEQDIIGTIRSRTQWLKVPNIAPDKLREVLQAQFDLDEGELDAIVHLSGGDYLAAVQAIQESENSAQNFDWFVELMRLGFGRQVPELLGWVDKLSGTGRERQKQFLRYALQMVRENFVFNTTRTDELVFLRPKERAFSEKFAQFIHTQNAGEIAKELDLAHYHIERNAYGKITLLDMALKIAHWLRPA